MKGLSGNKTIQQRLDEATSIVNNNTYQGDQTFEGRVTMKDVMNIEDEVNITGKVIKNGLGIANIQFDARQDGKSSFTIGMNYLNSVLISKNSIKPVHGV